MGGVHGDERSGPVVVDMVRRELEIDIMNNITDKLALWTVPTLNIGAYYKKKRRGPGKIDINRHFDVSDPKAPLYLKETMISLAMFQPTAFIDLHEDDVDEPYAFGTEHSSVTKAWAERCLLPLPPKPMKPCKGSEEFARSLGAASVTLELPTKWLYSNRIERGINIVRAFVETVCENH